MELNYYCTKCGDEMINPICESCRTKQLAILLNNNGVKPRIISYIIRKVRNNSFSHIWSDALCAICENELVYLCDNCYLKKVRDSLAAFALPDKLLTQLGEI